jgi:trigger factor
VQFRLLPELRFQDGNIPDLSALVGAKPGDVCEVDAKVGSASQDAAIRGQNIKIVFHVHDLKRLRLPELDCEFLDRIGFDDVADLRRGLEALLRRRFEFAQYQELRRQIVEKLVEKVPFELPPELVARQEETTLRRHIEEMRQGGMSENDIRARRAQIRANAHEQTLLSLKEYFLLAKIAEAEGIKVNDEDIEDEVELIASRTDESPRRVRARIRNEGLVDALSQQILERKTLDRIIELAQVTDVAMAQDKAVETLDEVASPQTEPTSSAAETESQTSESGEAP